ncbi:hypothetical protein [Streptosporangium amethystogenes]|uniref:hypothetical protein n=1 Tax=Streptosporangium amethystogenes TaxID=2002 RepID=UPI0004C56662|nr:hypothetical protein [Streptosporangium amethystogenes]
MPVPHSPGNPGETEILAGPTGEPGKPRRSQRRSGPAIAVFSVLAAAILGGGAVFAFVNGDQNDPGAPPPKAPESAQEAAQNPEPDQNAPQEEKQKPEKESGTASGGDDTSTGDADTDAGAGAGTGADRPSRSESGADPAAGKPAADKPSPQQSGPRKPQEVPDDPRADGATGYVHPQGPSGG